MPELPHEAAVRLALGPEDYASALPRPNSLSTQYHPSTPGQLLSTVPRQLLSVHHGPPDVSQANRYVVLGDHDLPTSIYWDQLLHLLTQKKLIDEQIKESWYRIMDRDSRSRRYDDGEVTRYGAGESYRPFNDRTPRRRSPPPRERPRSPPPRDRARSPLGGRDDDRYIPGRSPRRRSRSPERFRRDRSRDRERDRGRDDDRGLGADSWRRRDRTRSPARRPSPRRSPSRRSSPPPRRYSPPRRDDRDRRGFDSRDPRSFAPSRVQQYAPSTSSDWGASDQRLAMVGIPKGGPGERQGYVPRDALPVIPTGNRGYNAARGMTDGSLHRPVPSGPHQSRINILRRGRSRSMERDRRGVRDRDRRSPPPPRRGSLSRGRGGDYRRRSLSTDRRSYRRPSPPRESAVSSTLPSRIPSRRSSPHPSMGRRDDRSEPQSPGSHGKQSRSPQRAPPRDKSPVRQPAEPAPGRSPPRGPAALRAPPTGPRGDRERRDSRDLKDARSFSNQPASAIAPPSRPAATSVASRQDATSPSAPPSGPRGYGAPRGGFGRGGRGGSWNPTVQSRNIPVATGPASATTGSPNIPTGPRGQTPTSTSLPSTPISQSKLFNPPKGPSAVEKRPMPEKRQLSVFERELATMTPLIPGGSEKMSVEDEAAYYGVLPEQLPAYKARKEELEKMRKQMDKTNAKNRAMLADWERDQHQIKLAKLRSDLAMESLAKSCGDSYTGSAF